MSTRKIQHQNVARLRGQLRSESADFCVHHKESPLHPIAATNQEVEANISYNVRLESPGRKTDVLVAYTLWSTTDIQIEFLDTLFPALLPCLYLGERFMGVPTSKKRSRARYRMHRRRFLRSNSHWNDSIEYHSVPTREDMFVNARHNQLFVYCRKMNTPRPGVAGIGDVGGSTKTCKSNRTSGKAV